MPEDTRACVDDDIAAAFRRTDGGQPLDRLLLVEFYAESLG
jgi:hypothetical protein